MVIKALGGSKQAASSRHATVHLFPATLALSPKGSRAMQGPGGDPVWLRTVQYSTHYTTHYLIQVDGQTGRQAPPRLQK